VPLAFSEEPATVISFSSDTVQDKGSWTKNPRKQIRSNKIAPKQKYYLNFLLNSKNV
jgi:alkyl hydroperoxide reductase subunit AhpC